VTKILVKRERCRPGRHFATQRSMQVKEDVGEEELNSEIELIESDDVLRQTVIANGLQRHSRCCRTWESVPAKTSRFRRQ